MRRIAHSKGGWYITNEKELYLWHDGKWHNGACDGWNEYGDVWERRYEHGYYRTSADAIEQLKTIEGNSVKFSLSPAN